MCAESGLDWLMCAESGLDWLMCTESGLDWLMCAESGLGWLICAKSGLKWLICVRFAKEAGTTPGSSWGYSKSPFSSNLLTLSDKYPQKWLQDRANGSKNALGIP